MVSSRLSGRECRLSRWCRQASTPYLNPNSISSPVLSLTVLLVLSFSDDLPEGSCRHCEYAAASSAMGPLSSDSRWLSCFFALLAARLCCRKLCWTSGSLAPGLAMLWHNPASGDPVMTLLLGRAQIVLAGLIALINMYSRGRICFCSARTTKV